MNVPAPPRPSVAEMQQRLAVELSTRARVVLTLLLLVDLAVGIVVLSLWLTEPSLPLRTQVAFGLLLAGAAAWAIYFGWTLSRRKVLLARQRVITGWIAFSFTGLLTLGCVVLAITQPSARNLAFTAAAMGATFCVGAGLLLQRAHAGYQELVDRREALARELGAS